MKDYLNTLNDLYYKLEILNEGKEENKKELNKLEKENKILNSEFKNLNYSIEINEKLIARFAYLQNNLNKYRNIGLVTTLISAIALIITSFYGPVVFSFAAVFSALAIMVGFYKYLDSVTILKSNNTIDIENTIYKNVQEKHINRKKYYSNKKQIQLINTIINNIDMDIKKLLENVNELEELCSEFVKKILEEEKTLNIFNQVLEEEIKTNNKIYLKKKNNSN